MASSLLLANAQVLEHGLNYAVTSRIADVLVVGNQIKQVAPNLTSTADAHSAQVIDCTDKIVTPGFVDAHLHTWETQLKGRFADDMFDHYLVTGNRAFIYYEAEDLFLGQLGGALEGIAAGTTTILDFDHGISGPDSITAGAEGLIASGVRAVYTIGPVQVPINDSYSMNFEEPVIQPWFYETYKDVGTRLLPEKAEGRIQMGFNLDYAQIDLNKTLELYKQVLDLGVVKLASFHNVGNDAFALSLLNKGINFTNMVLAHSNSYNLSYYDTMIKAGAHFASTPSSELQMAFGWPVCYNNQTRDASAIGVDIHSLTAASVVEEARIGLQAYRMWVHQETLDAGMTPDYVNATVEQAFNLLTLGGARAMHLDDKIGSVKEGMLADLLVWDTTSPAMIAAAQQDPVAAIVLHSSPADLRHVVVDGKLRKMDGKLLPVQINGTSTDYTQVAKDLIESRNRVKARFDAADIAAGRPPSR